MNVAQAFSFTSARKQTIYLLLVSILLSVACAYCRIDCCVIVAVVCRVVSLFHVSYVAIVIINRYQVKVKYNRGFFHIL